MYNEVAYGTLLHNIKNYSLLYKFSKFRIAMTKENFLLLSLNDTKAKKITNLVNNESSRKILNILSEKEATESEISRELKIPISTVHYNLEQLKKAGLVNWENYHYSEKGREVRHYKLVNKYIIIAPSTDKSFLDKIKTLFPALIVTTIASGFIYNLTNKTPQNTLEVAKDRAMNIAIEEAPKVATASQTLDPVFWFLFGSFIVILTMFIVMLITKKDKFKTP